MKKANYYNSIYVERKSTSEKAKLLLAGIIVALAICFFMVLPVKSQNAYGKGVSEETYLAWEKAYRSDVKEVLTHKGLDMGGVTMTKTYQEDGTRCYDVIIHHERIAKLSTKEKANLIEALQAVDFPENESDFTFILRCDSEGKSI